MHNGCGKDLLIDILLTILGYIPGIMSDTSTTWLHTHRPLTVH